uniref:L-rhamnose-binding lectin CSL3-like n=1 Tax=Saccoglossus kowalevskii TaxID=10224 RepID=A0ABM0M2X0_SACKO|nr:PREDICTED: L-rhamnose-binding lectin CSL3-like [Saccoglossus kowalevskii]
MNIYIVVLLCIISDSLASPIFKRWQRQVSALYTSVCDNKQMQLICFGDGEILRIESANYGRTDTQLCPSRLDTTNTNCSAENSFQIVSERCNGKDECRIPVNTGVFGGDPCPETEKYLEVSYFCETAAITPFSTVTTPSLAAARTTAATQLVTEEDGSFFTVVCENNQMSLTCFDGKVLKIVYANYGRTDEITCNSEEQNQDTNCRDPNSLQVVQNSCENNAACEIEVNNDVFSDLCIGVFKYLAVRYKCVIPSPS